MKIIVHYKPDEDAEADAVIEALRAVMPTFNLFQYQDSEDRKGDGTHSKYFVHNGKHPEI